MTAHLHPPGDTEVIRNKESHWSGLSHCISKGFFLLAFRWWPKHWNSRWRIITIVGPTVDSSSPQSSLWYAVIITMLVSKSFEVLINVFFLQF